jgi:hypothetical protein
MIGKAPKINVLHVLGRGAEVQTFPITEEISFAICTLQSVNIH